jgi:hypothetical protein
MLKVLYNNINYNAWRELVKYNFTYFNSFEAFCVVRSLARISFFAMPALFHFFFFPTHSTLLKMRKTLKVENRCCSWTLILFMCVFSLIFLCDFHKHQQQPLSLAFVAKNIYRDAPRRKNEFMTEKTFRNKSIYFSRNFWIYPTFKKSEKLTKFVWGSIRTRLQKGDVWGGWKHFP